MTEAYDPRRDSSPGTDDLRSDAAGADLDENGQPFGVDGLILVVEDVKGSQTCACGCTRRVAGKARFVQGHDQRLIGKLLRAQRGGEEVALRSGAIMSYMSPESYARLVLTGAGVAKYVAAAARPVTAPKRAAAARQPVSVAGTVKIGRWTYTATQYGTGEVSYTKKDGTEHQADAKAAATFTAA